MQFLIESNKIERVFDEPSVYDALHAWQYLMKFRYLNSERILECHKILMRRQNIPEKYKWSFRDIPVYVWGHEWAKPNTLQMEMHKYCIAMRPKPVIPDGLAERICREFHVIFEKIHPFYDGNGRIWRIIMNWHRLKKLNLPLLVIHAGQEQMEYYKWFK